jgi:hypothetical protein
VQCFTVNYSTAMNKNQFVAAIFAVFHDSADAGHHDLRYRQARLKLADAVAFFDPNKAMQMRQSNLSGGAVSAHSDSVASTPGAFGTKPPTPNHLHHATAARVAKKRVPPVEAQPDSEEEGATNEAQLAAQEMIAAAENSGDLTTDASAGDEFYEEVAACSVEELKSRYSRAELQELCEILDTEYASNHNKAQLAALVRKAANDRLA